VSAANRAPNGADTSPKKRRGRSAIEDDEEEEDIVWRMQEDEPPGSVTKRARTGKPASGVAQIPDMKDQKNSMSQARDKKAVKDDVRSSF